MTLLPAPTDDKTPVPYWCRFSTSLSRPKTAGTSPKRSRSSKYRTAAKAAWGTLGTIEVLRAWQLCQNVGRDFIFCAINNGDAIGLSAPISGTDVYRIVKATEEACGIAFKPHDLRRTFITEVLATGTPLGSRTRMR